VFLNDIELASYRRLGYSDTPATEVVTRIRQWINIWHQRLLARPGVELLRDVTVTFPSVVGQAQYPLPASIRRVQKISEPFSPTALRQEAFSWIRENDPQTAALGIPEAWAPVTWQLIAPPLPQLVIQLWPTPSAILTYNVDSMATAVDMVNPLTDEPLLPFEYHWLLVEAACYEEWLRKADSRAGTARQDMETGFKEMRHWLANPYDYKPVAGGNQPMPSRLGGMYPAWRNQ
jgi:hypothetical protein